MKRPCGSEAGSISHFERPCSSEGARAAISRGPAAPSGLERTHRARPLKSYMTSLQALLLSVYIYIYIYICVFECQLWLNMRFILVFRRPGGRVLWERCPPTYDWGDIKHAKKIYRKRLPPTWTISYIAICI